jgi:hypothetical protein
MVPLLCLQLKFSLSLSLSISAIKIREWLKVTNLSQSGSKKMAKTFWTEPHTFKM